MQYQETDYETDRDSAPWTAEPTPSSNLAATRANSGNLVTATRSREMTPQPSESQVAVRPPPQPNTSEILVIGSLVQSVQQAQTQQMYLLRDMDARLARLEDNARYGTTTVVAAPQSFERATWWAIWGLLMLILGGALAVVTLLILLNIQFR